MAWNKKKKMPTQTGTTAFVVSSSFKYNDGNERRGKIARPFVDVLRNWIVFVNERRKKSNNEVNGQPTVKRRRRNNHSYQHSKMCVLLMYTCVLWKRFETIHLSLFIQN